MAVKIHHCNQFDKIIFSRQTNQIPDDDYVTAQYSKCDD